MIEVLHPGMLSTVQDLGRHGYTQLGISPAGAADEMLLRMGNLLLGNPENAAAIEFTGRGGRYRFLSDAWIVVSGAFPVRLGANSIPAMRALAVKAGETLSVGEAVEGLRGYLCVAGGMEVPVLLGSRSTHLPSGLGGFAGRALRAGDLVPVGANDGRGIPLDGQRPIDDLWVAVPPESPLRLTPGPHLEYFEPSALQELCHREWVVKPDSSRMGVRLKSKRIEAKPNRESAGFFGGTGKILSEGVPLGALQTTPSGELILLGVDAQTTGGYPILGSLISVDLSRLGQLRPGDIVRFDVVTLEVAYRLLMERETRIYQWKERL